MRFCGHHRYVTWCVILLAVPTVTRPSFLPGVVHETTSSDLSVNEPGAIMDTVGDGVVAPPTQEVIVLGWTSGIENGRS